MILGLLAKNRKGHQNCILLVQRKFSARNYFWEKKIITFAIAAEKAQTFYRIFCHGCQIFHPRVQKKELLREQKFEKQESSIHFSSFREKVSKFCKKFYQSLRTCVLPIQWINSSKKFSWNVMYLRGFSGLRARRFGIFAESFLLEISKNLFTCSKLCFGSNFSLKIWLHFLKFKQKRFRSIVKTFRERCQNYIPRLHNILLKNNVFRTIYIFLPFGLSALTFWMFGDIFLFGLSKLHFMG